MTIFTPSFPLIAPRDEYTAPDLPAAFPGRWDRLYREWLSDDDFLDEMPEGPDAET